MSILKIAFLQLMPGADAGENREIGLRACREAKEMGADIALFPEMWSSGYRIPATETERRELPVAADGEFVRAFREEAEKLRMAVGITYLERYDPLPRNTLSLFDRRGEEVLRYAKVHTCDFDIERQLARGDGFYTAPLETGAGVVQAGAMICFDREFPESARVLMLEGAELVLVPNACPMELNRLSQLRARAFENMMAVATCNYPAGHPDCNGHSTLFDGIAWEEGDGSRDCCLLEAGGEPGIYLAALDLDRLRRYREGEVFGNAYRRPGVYRVLAEEAVRQPFVRGDARR